MKATEKPMTGTDDMAALPAKKHWFCRDMGAEITTIDLLKAVAILTMVVEDDHVAVRFHIQATHQDQFAGIPASGNKVDFTGMVLYRLRDRRIAETWLHPDVTTLMSQLTAQ